MRVSTPAIGNVLQNCGLRAEKTKADPHAAGQRHTCRCTVHGTSETAAPCLFDGRRQRSYRPENLLDSYLRFCTFHRKLVIFYFVTIFVNSAVTYNH